MRKLHLLANVLGLLALLPVVGGVAFAASARSGDLEGFGALAAVLGAMLLFSLAGALAGGSLLASQFARMEAGSPRLLGLGGVAVIGLVASGILFTVGVQNAAYRAVPVAAAAGLLAAAGVASAVKMRLERTRAA